MWAPVLLLLASGSLSDPVIQTMLAALGTIAVAIIGVLGAQLAKRTSRGVDQATAEKLHQDARKTAIDATQSEIATIRSIADERQKFALERIDLVKEESQRRLEEMRTEHAEDRVRAESEIKELKDRMREYEERQRLFLASVIAHLPWDADALNRLRADDPGWSSPPPFKGIDS